MPDDARLDAVGAPSGDLLIERLLRVIDEGRRTATYKLALLSALIDAVAALPGERRIPTRVLARHVVALYYPQTREYVANDGIARELRQISMKSSPVLRAVLRLRRAGDSARCRTVDEAERRVPDVYRDVVDSVEDTFVRYPVRLLQVVGARELPFLYEIDWASTTSLTRLRREGRDYIDLLPGVADRLVVLGPMLRPLIELHWTRDVARWTGVSLEDTALQAHLFGVERVTFPRAIVVGLRDLQDGRCFYCGEAFGAAVHVDHFLPWSRWPNDAVENLVLADRCNLAKSDHLVNRRHLDHWRQYVGDHQTPLATLAQRAGWTSDPARTIGLVRSTYGHIASGTPLWSYGSSFEIATGPLVV